MINDSDAKLSRYVSVPPSMGSINTDAFVAGILRGVLETAEFVSFHRGIMTAASWQWHRAFDIPCLIVTHVPSWGVALAGALGGCVPITCISLPSRCHLI